MKIQQIIKLFLKDLLFFMQYELYGLIRFKFNMWSKRVLFCN